MSSLIGGAQNCKRCGHEVESGSDTCSSCYFNPKSKGLRVALALLMAVIVLMTAVLLLPFLSLLFVRLAGVAFGLALLVFVISFISTPYRFGSLFLWF